MKTIEELILAQKSPTSNTEPPPRKKWEPHYINLKMNYNGGRRGRKTEEERKELEGEFKLKVLREKIYLFFD